MKNNFTDKTIGMLMVAATFAMLLGGCVHYDADEFEGKVMPRATGAYTGVTDDWLYFNLRTGEAFNLSAPNQDITEGDQLKRLDWDIAFCGAHIRTNGGTSGPGKGAAADLGFGDYDHWQGRAQIPGEVKWVEDDTTSVYVTYSQREWYNYVNTHYLKPDGTPDNDGHPWFDPNRGPARRLTSGNPLLEQCIKIEGPPMTYTPSYHVYVIRCADGVRCFKLQVVSWFNQQSSIDDEGGGQMSYYIDELK